MGEVTAFIESRRSTEGNAASCLTLLPTLSSLVATLLKDSSLRPFTESWFGVYLNVWRTSLPATLTLPQFVNRQDRR